MCHRCRGVGAEGLERRGLGRGHHDLRLHPALAQARGGEDRQLVERQRPEGAEGDRERDRAAVARLHVVERRADGGGVAAAAEADRPGERADGAGADADEQGVVGKATRIRRDRLVRGRAPPRPGNRERVARPGRRRSARAPCSRPARRRTARGRRAGGTRSGARGTAGRCAARLRSRNERKARHASRPATPPPAMTMRGEPAAVMDSCSARAGRSASGTPGGPVAAFPQRQAVGRAAGALRWSRAVSSTSGSSSPACSLAIQAVAPRRSARRAKLGSSSSPTTMTGTSASRGPRPEPPSRRSSMTITSGRGPAPLARQLLEAAGLGHEGDARQRAQQDCDRALAGARDVGEQHAQRLGRSRPQPERAGTRRRRARRRGSGIASDEAAGENRPSHP